MDVHTLHEYEKLVLPVLFETTEHQKIQDKTGLENIQLSRAYQWLENKGLITLKYDEFEKTVLHISQLPFRQIFNSFKDSISIAELAKKLDVDIAYIMSENGIAQLKKAGVVSVDKKENILTLTKTQTTLAKQPIEEFVDSFPKEGVQPTAEQMVFIKLLRRITGAVQSSKTKIPLIELTAEGKKIDLDSIKNDTTISQLTSDMIKSGEYKQSQFRPYDVTAKVPQIHPGRVHPMTAVIKIVKDIFLEMGFTEMKGPWVETAFWCMDSMWIPQDHPARDVQDTFYLNKTGDLPASELVKKVKEVHETGGKTGSTGYGYKWDPKLASELILRTHTTATTYRYFHEKVKQGPAKYFYVGKVFRNEAIDATHLPEFYQVEGFVMDDGLTIQHLLGFIKEFYKKLGYEKIRFKTTYNPYTEPSVEAMFYDEKRGKWLELINSGMFRPESLAPYGITQPVIAWGLGLERLAMLLLEQNKLKDLIGPSADLTWLRNYSVVKRNGNT